eukprot:GHVT01053138.1.p1 GENE.GHVT01053138.1~~GHVT01053138.1.p1  ORF type:complete len:486 (+),score=104.05 GHVT01053138.1:193-1650(+)
MARRFAFAALRPPARPTFCLPPFGGPGAFCWSVPRPSPGGRSFAASSRHGAAESVLKEGHHRVLVVGAGAAGMAVANKLAMMRDFKSRGSVAVIEPSEHHYYPPLWTLAAAGLADVKSTVQPTAALMPSTVDWYVTEAASFDPERHVVQTKDGRAIHYDALVLATGTENNYGAIRGFKQELGKSISTIYGYDYCSRVWELIEGFQGGTAIFSIPPTPVKCPGAPQKIMYLAEDYWSRSGLGPKTNVRWISGCARQFAIPKYEKALASLCDQRGIRRDYLWNLVEVKPAENLAIFERVSDPSQTGAEAAGAPGREAPPPKMEVPYDFLHVVPPQVPPLAVRSSPLANSSGFVDVDAETLQSKIFPNVLAIGDCSSVPTSKTGAAVAAELPHLVANLRSILRGDLPTSKYNGYASCPIVCGRGQAILAEFSAFTGQPMETFPFDQSVPRRSMYLLKKHILPLVYWQLMVKGLWTGSSALRRLFHPLG